MPIYEYVCQDCKNEFEALVRGAESPTCASCGSEKLNRLLSVPAAHTASCRPRGVSVARPGNVRRWGCGLPQCGM